MKRYIPAEIEPKWQATWEKDGIYRASEDPSKPKRYVLEYFPYPSGAAMHVGHVRNYTIGDAIARHYRMRGYNVMHPMGWDAFGLPAENYAIKNNISPQQAIAENTAKFKQQLIQMGFSYDWSREVNSSDPSYYKWTQWFFKLLFERGLAYQKNSLQWWCPHDQTVLANEQVENGRCWRCGHEVVKKPLKQWFFKITDYADRLTDDLDKLDWSDAIKSMQRNWIGKSVGAEVDFKIDGTNSMAKVFTTRPDTLFGVTFLVVAPEHELVKVLTTDQQKKAVDAYIKTTQSKSDIERQETDREKTGVFTGSYVVNPINDEKIPVWVADYVLAGYGTGVVMGVPGHDERDHEFAQKFNLQIREVVEPETGIPQENPEFRSSIVAIVHDPVTDKYLSINWGKDGGNLFIGGGRETDEDIVETAKREITEETGYSNLKLISQTGRIWHNYFAHSKNVARRIEANALLLQLVDDTQKPTALEANEQGKFTVEWLNATDIEAKVSDELHVTAYKLLVKNECYHGEGIMTNSGPYDGLSSSEVREKIITDLAKTDAAQEKVNYKIRDWLISRQRYWGAPIPIIHCPEHGAVAVPDNQLPVELPEVKSYQPTGEGTSVLASVPEWVNTTCPTCGKPAKRETDTMDGFACSSWYFLRFADPHNDKKPFDADKVKFWLPVDDYIGGAEHAVMHLLYARMWTKVMFDADMIEFDEPFNSLRNQGMILAPDGRKMSKSWGNVIAPDDIIAQGYGADAIRIMELFIGPWNQEAAWSVEGMGGCYRFLQRVWNLVQEYTENTVEHEAPLAIVHKTIKKVSDDVERMSFNTAIAAQMELVNDLYRAKADGMKSESWLFTLKSLVQLIAPFAPHITEELWQHLGQANSVHTSEWPKWDDAYLVSDTVTLALQVNGKVRAEMTVDKDATRETVESAALSHERVRAFMDDKQPKRVIYVPGRLVNIVV